MFPAVLFKLEITQMPMNTKTDQSFLIYSYNEIFSADTEQLLQHTTTLLYLRNVILRVPKGKYYRIPFNQMQKLAKLISGVGLGDTRYS